MQQGRDKRCGGCGREAAVDDGRWCCRAVNGCWWLVEHGGSSRPRSGCRSMRDPGRKTGRGRGVVKAGEIPFHYRDTEITEEGEGQKRPGADRAFLKTDLLLWSTSFVYRRDCEGTQGPSTSFGWRLAWLGMTRKSGDDTVRKVLQARGLTIWTKWKGTLTRWLATGSVTPVGVKRRRAWRQWASTAAMSWRPSPRRWRAGSTETRPRWARLPRGSM